MRPALSSIVRAVLLTEISDMRNKLPSLLTMGCPYKSGTSVGEQRSARKRVAEMYKSGKYPEDVTLSTIADVIFSKSLFKNPKASSDDAWLEEITSAWQEPLGEDAGDLAAEVRKHIKRASPESSYSSSPPPHDVDPRDMEAVYENLRKVFQWHRSMLDQLTALGKSKIMVPRTSGDPTPGTIAAINLVSSELRMMWQDNRGDGYFKNVSINDPSLFKLNRERDPEVARKLNNVRLTLRYLVSVPRSDNSITPGGIIISMEEESTGSYLSATRDKKFFFRVVFPTREPILSPDQNGVFFFSPGGSASKGFSTNPDSGYAPAADLVNINPWLIHNKL